LLAATHPALADAQNAEMSPENQKSFGIQLESGEIHFSPVANHRLDRLDIEGMPNSVADAEDWLSPLLGDPRFSSTDVKGLFASRLPSSHSSRAMAPRVSYRGRCAS